MAQATLSCPFGAIHLEDRRGTAQNGHSVSIFAHPIPFVASRHLPLTGGVGPRTLFTGVTPWSRQNPSGAQNLSGCLNSRRATSSSRISYPSLRPGRAKLAHSIAPPLQRKPASLGFALGAAFGGLLDGKFRMVRFHNCAWVVRTNVPGSVSIVGAGVLTRPPRNVLIGA